MSVKRDYGNFSKASPKIMAALVAPLGYTDLGRGFFGRPKDGWVEGFFLQQTQYGDGSFCINIGIAVPALYERWLTPAESPSALLLSARLSASGVDGGDCWLPAADKTELAHSLAQVASWLPLVEPWFAQFRTRADVAQEYRRRSHLVEPGRNAWAVQVAAANYGFLLAEAGVHAEARTWLQEAERLMSLPVYFGPGAAGMRHDKVKGARLQKPTQDELRQLQAVRSSLQALDAT